MPCPHLSYRRSHDGDSFDEARGFCTITASFVQPMRADICNDRYDLHHESHCEIYRAHEEQPSVEASDDDAPVEGSGNDPPVEGSGNDPPVEGSGNDPPVEGTDDDPPVEASDVDMEGSTDG